MKYYYETRVLSEIVGKYPTKKQALKAGISFKKRKLNKGSRAKIKILKFTNISEFY